MSSPNVTGLSGFGMEVPDLGVAKDFYSTFGLEVLDEGGALKMGSPGRNHEECVLVEGARKKLHHVSFFIDPADEGAFAEKIKAYGLEVNDTAPGAWSRAGIWFQDPWGTWVNLVPKTPSVRKIDNALPSNLNGRMERVDMHLWQEMEKACPPMRIGHMLMFTQDWEKTEAFYQQVLGLRTSDKAAGKVAFMSAGSGVKDHHCFGLINATHRGMQHASFQVPGFDDIGFGAWRMREGGFKETFGPGRHAIASNLFHYIRDPWGSWVEYYADMDKISEAWVSREFNALPYIWGPEWSPEFWGGEMNANFEPKD